MLVDHWIDIHGHFFPPMTADEGAEIALLLRQACWCIDEPVHWDPAATLAYMDRTGIQMQMLSYVPPDVTKLRAANDYGAALVRKHPDRFGLLAALPTQDAELCLAEIGRIAEELSADGYAVQCLYNEVALSDAKLEPVWAELDRRRATVFAHPNAYGSAWGRPAALMDVAFQTAHVFADMLYAGVFRRYPNIRFVVAHCGGALPAVSGRLLTLGNESWIPNPQKITPTEMRQHLRRLFLDTAATMPTGLGAALLMTTPDKIVYGSDCGVPCTTDATMDTNIEALLAFEGLSAAEIQAIGQNALNLFPKAAARIADQHAQRTGDPASRRSLPVA
jgi:predicted TIM-barrel fold metal-dependent hydrolase